MITSAALITENPNGYDWITRYRAYHRGQNRFPPEARLFPPHPALAVPETQTKLGAALYRTSAARIKYSAGDRKECDDFTPEKRNLILILAREAKPHVY